MKRKTYHRFSFTNDYVFAEVMKDPELCRQLLERILPDRKISAIRLCDENERGISRDVGSVINGSNSHQESTIGISPASCHNSNPYLSPASETQKDISFNARSKGIRLDILFRDEAAWYNIELQCSMRYDIHLRSRYYGGLIDLDQLNKGDEYVKLKNTYIIFICTFDMFGLGEPIYFFENYDVKNRLKFNDRSYRIIVNTRGMKEDMSKELKTLFEYINEASVEEGDSFVEKVDEQVRRLNREDNAWRREAMRLDEEFALRERIAREEALKEGEEATRKTVAARLLEKGMPPEEVAEITELTVEEIEMCRS